MTAIAAKLSTAAAFKPNTAAARRGCPRRAFTWEMAGVLALMGSSAAYALLALAHLG